MTSLIRKTLFTSGAFALVYFAAHISAAASCFPSTSTIVMEEVSYVPTTVTNNNDPRASYGIVHLTGWLYYRIPSGGTVKNAPVLIYNHGHDAERSQPCEIARYFVNQGFVVFAPLRRGHFGDGLASTGIHTDEYVADCLSSGQCPPCNLLDPNTCIANAYAIDYLRQQYVDVRDAISYVRSHAPIGKGTKGKMADPTRIAIMGHSYGGALMVFTNAQLSNYHNVAIDISGGELSWENSDEPFWKSELKPAARDAKRPMYFLQPKNGVSLEPTKVLFSEEVDQRFRVQASIFPPAPWDSVCEPHRTICWDSDKDQLISEAQQAHSTFILEKTQVEFWGPSVVDFINRYPLSP
ncbi:MAG TPA: alpha/beta fold hydrolase [Pyrinomonadaceae bacterium]|jgi:pimeloyl-ACP methyl ester carboxylesterase|nr:alpha/beta fold hydrolase [Pyrinomonadaceae bacterium]